MNTPPALWPPPLDLYGLGLLRLIAARGSITHAAAAAGLTQSALTRQLQNMESRLGVALFDRTSRTLRLTAAGETLLRETAPLQTIMETALRRLGQEHLAAPQEVKLGVSRSLALAHFPGLLHVHLRQSAGVKTIIEHLPGAQVLQRLETGQLDAAVLCPPRRLPPSLRVTHRMEDGFHLIAPAEWKAPAASRRWTASLTGWLSRQPWLLHSAGSQTGQQLRRWLRERGITAQPVMEPDDFDLAVNLTALGMGMSMVPRRALAGFSRRGRLQRIPLPEEFSRSLAVVVLKQSLTPRHVEEFVSRILFS